MSNTAIKIPAPHNYICIIDCLPSNDLQTARHLYEEMNDYNLTNPRIKFFVDLFEVANAREFMFIMDKLEVVCENGWLPLIHIECHGDIKRGLSIGDCGENIEWGLFISRLRNINIVTGNKLSVVMASCYGLHGVEIINVDKPCPFNFLVGSSSKVPAGFIRDNMIDFYKVLYEQGELSEAVSALGGNFSLYHAEQLFYYSFGLFLNNTMSAKNRKKRLERATTEMVRVIESKGVEPNMREIRSTMKGRLKNPEETFSRLAKIYLHGSNVINYDEFYHLFKESQSKR